jgi:hypothetical protein
MNRCALKSCSGTQIRGIISNAELKWTVDTVKEQDNSLPGGHSRTA